MNPLIYAALAQTAKKVHAEVGEKKFRQLILAILGGGLIAVLGLVAIGAYLYLQAN